MFLSTLDGYTRYIKMKSVNGFSLHNVVSALLSGTPLSAEHLAVLRDELDDHHYEEFIEVNAVGSVIAEGDVYDLLRDVCDNVHATCSHYCPYYNLMADKCGNDPEKTLEFISKEADEAGGRFKSYRCPCFKDGKRMAERIAMFK